MQTGERKDVYKVYDKIAQWYAENRYNGLMEQSYLDDMIGRIPVGGYVLDLGCGNGKPILEYLVNKRLNVTGVDASTAMLAIAKANFPGREFILQDMRLLALGKQFDAIIAWHSFFHLPPDDQPAMFKRFTEHLNPNGILIFTSGTQHGEAWGINGGENLCHGSLTTAEYQKLFDKHNFKVLRHAVSDPDCGYATVWVGEVCRVIVYI